MLVTIETLILEFKCTTTSPNTIKKRVNFSTDFKNRITCCKFLANENVKGKIQIYKGKFQIHNT